MCTWCTMVCTLPGGVPGAAARGGGDARRVCVVQPARQDEGLGRIVAFTIHIIRCNRPVSMYQLWVETTFTFGRKLRPIYPHSLHNVVTLVAERHR